MERILSAFGLTPHPPLPPHHLQGNNKNGRMGNGEFGEVAGGGHESGDETYEYTPQKVVKGTDFVSISAKGSHTCGLKGDGSAWCWGGNEEGELGIGDTSLGENTPQKVPGTWKAVTSGLKFSCGINTSVSVTVLFL